MNRMRLLVTAGSFSALLFAPGLAPAQDSEPLGGMRYGGAPAEEEAAPAEMHRTETEKLKETEKTTIEKKEVQRTRGLEEEAVPAPMVTEEPIIEREPKYLTRFGEAVSLGGGVADFVDNDIDGFTDPAGQWEVRLTLGTRSLVGIEAAYVGTAQDVDALGLDDDAVLVSNSAEAVARLNIGTYAIQPFVFGGASYIRYSIVNEDFNVSSLRGSDNVLGIPFGGGISGHFMDHWMADARFTYRAAMDEDLLRPGTGNEQDEDLDNWSVTARIGYEF